MLGAGSVAAPHPVPRRKQSCCSKYGSICIQHQLSLNSTQRFPIAPISCHLLNLHSCSRAGCPRSLPHWSHCLCWSPFTCHYPLYGCTTTLYSVDNYPAACLCCLSVCRCAVARSPGCRGIQRVDRLHHSYEASVACAAGRNNSTEGHQEESVEGGWRHREDIARGLGSRCHPAGRAG